MEDKLKNRKRVYCEALFWEKFIKNRPERSTPLFSDEKEIKEDEVWTSLLKFICSSNLIFDTSPSDYFKKHEGDETCNWLQKLLHLSASGMGCHVDVCENNFPYLTILNKSTVEEKQLLSVFLTSENCEEEAQSLGVICFAPNCLYKYSHFFMDNGIAVGEDEDFNWKILKEKARHNCNSMIIVDNYLISKDWNLKEILDALLPELIEVKFYITLITGETDNLKKRTENLKSFIKSKRPNLKFDLQTIEAGEFIKDKNDQSKERWKNFLHDRTIITNYIWIKSGAGFDLSNYNYANEPTYANKSTTIEVLYPFFYFGDNGYHIKAYEDLLIDVDSVFEKRNMFPNNRLF